MKICGKNCFLINISSEAYTVKKLQVQIPCFVTPVANQWELIHCNNFQDLMPEKHWKSIGNTILACHEFSSHKIGYFRPFLLRVGRNHTILTKDGKLQKNSGSIAIMLPVTDFIIGFNHEMEKNCNHF